MCVFVLRSTNHDASHANSAAAVLTNTHQLHALGLQVLRIVNPPPPTSPSSPHPVKKAGTHSGSPCWEGSDIASVSLACCSRMGGREGQRRLASPLVLFEVYIIFPFVRRERRRGEFQTSTARKILTQLSRKWEEQVPQPTL